MDMKCFASILLVFIFSTLNAQKGNKALSNWNSDGNNDIALSADQYFSAGKTRPAYFISNDNTNIFINMKIDDSEVQSKILLLGLTVWINMDGKSERNLGVRFPIGSQHSAARKGQNFSGSDPEEEGKPVSPLSLAKTIELIGFISEEVRRFSSDNNDTFSGSVSYDKNGVLYYKLKMPLTKIPVRNAKGGGGAMPFTLGIEYGYPANQSGTRTQGGVQPKFSGASKSGSSRGSKPGGGGGRSQNAGRQGNSQNTSQPAESPVIFWIKNIRLATDK
jgi:hypothetical protein